MPVQTTQYKLPKNMRFCCDDFIKDSIQFLRKQRKKRNARKLIVGLSGGIDSAVVAILCKKAVEQDVIAVFMPSSTTSTHSLEDAVELAKAFDIELEHISIAPYDILFREQNPNITPLKVGNFCARLRMTMLYNFASMQKGIVIGTSNKSELMLGYGTIFGDLGYAINPIGGLLKTQIFALAHALKVPESIITKPPSADLYPNQSDEKELGFSYAQIDPLLVAITKKYGNFQKPKNYKHIEKKYFKEFDTALVDMVLTRIKSNLFKHERPSVFDPRI